MTTEEKEKKKKPSNPMHFYCAFCGSLITNAIGECYACLNADQDEPYDDYENGCDGCDDEEHPDDFGYEDEYGDEIYDYD